MERRPIERREVSPTHRTIAAFKSAGYLVEKTEHWNSFCKRRQDLFNFIDILAIKGDEIIGIQTTSTANVSARITKILGLQSALLWASSPNRKILVQGWAKRGPRGTRKVWESRDVWITYEQFNPFTKNIS